MLDKATYNELYAIRQNAAAVGELAKILYENADRVLKKDERVVSTARSKKQKGLSPEQLATLRAKRMAKFEKIKN